MKISPINNFMPVNNTPNFKGLWGKTIYDNRTEAEYYIDDTTYEYYPFSDEKKEEIEAVKSAKSSYKEDIPGKGVVADPWVHSTGVFVKIMPVLPFTSKEFTLYTMNRLSMTKQHRIENYIINKGLTILRKH